MHKSISKTTLVACLTLLFIGIISCKKNTDLPTPAGSGGEPSGTLFSNTERVDATFLGKVLQEDGTPIAGAIVHTGSHQTTTDVNGLFYFHDIKTPKHASFIEVEMQGYFKGYRTLSVIPNEDNPVEVRLLAQDNAQSFDANQGGSVSIPNGGTLVFSPNAIVLESNGTAYTGMVTVKAKSVAADHNHIHTVSPGGFRGITAEGYEKLIAAYGFAAIELSDPMGNALQLADGKTAELRLPIVSSVSGIAPNELSLLSLDESNGMWRSEEVAQKQGNTYVGQVSHFSYWSFGSLATPVAFQVSLIDQNSNPLANHTVRLTATGFPIAGNGVTNSLGTASGFIPGNTSFVLECIGPNACASTVLHTQNFSTTNTSVNLGNIQLNTTSTTITGTSEDCNSNALPNSVVNILINGSSYQLLSNATGVFTLVLPCTISNTTADITAMDHTNIVQGTSNVSIMGGILNNVGVVQACGTLTEFITWTSVGGTTNNYTVTEGVNGGNCAHTNGPNGYYIDCRDATSVGAANIIFGITGPANTIGPHNITYYADMFDGNNTIVGTPALSYTTYGPIGGYLEGNFSLTTTSSNIGNRTITGNFRVKRSY